MTPAWLLGKKVVTTAAIRSGLERLPAFGGVRTRSFRVCNSPVSCADSFPSGREQAEERRGCPECGENTRGSLGRRHGAGERVHEQGGSCARGPRGRKQAIEARANDQAGDMGHHQTNPPDHTRNRHHACGHQCRRRDQQHAKPARVDAERGCFLVAQRHQVHLPAEQDQRHQADRHEGQYRPDVTRLRAGQRAQQPKRDRGKLIVRIGQDLHQRNARTRQCSEHDARKHQDQHRIVAADRRCDGVHHCDRPQPSRESEALSHDHGHRHQDAHCGAQSGSGRHAEDVRRHQRIPEQALIDRPGSRQGGADQQGCQHARNAHREQHGLELGIRFAHRSPGVIEQRVEDLDDRDGIRPDRDG